MISETKYSAYDRVMLSAFCDGEKKIISQVFLFPQAGLRVCTNCLQGNSCVPLRLGAPCGAEINWAQNESNKRDKTSFKGAFFPTCRIKVLAVLQKVQPMFLESIALSLQAKDIIYIGNYSFNSFKLTQSNLYITIKVHLFTTIHKVKEILPALGQYTTKELNAKVKKGRSTRRVISKTKVFMLKVGVIRQKSVPFFEQCVLCLCGPTLTF